MDSLDRTHLEALRTAVRTLEATGANGFEGLIAAVLSDITGQPFRLASSGTQRGRDGDSAFDASATYFEAKLYKDEVPKPSVIVKLADLAIDNAGQVDLWVLASTAPTSSQHARDYEDNAALHGIGIQILDWSSVTLPPLAIALTLAKTTVRDFLQANLTDPAHVAVVADAIAAMDHIEAMPEWNALSQSLKAKLSDASVGLGLAKSANKTWLETMFSNRLTAHSLLGQPLAPLDPHPVQPRSRTQIKTLAPAYAGQSGDMIFAVIGDEGAGKSWLAVQAWLESNPQSVLIICTGDELARDDIQNDVEGFLITKLAQQTSSALTEPFKARWRRRFKGWRDNPDPENVRLTLLIDGLNQTPAVPWARRIEAAAYFLRLIGGKLVITTRAPHFARIRNGIASKLKRILLPDWTENELNELLTERRIDANRLSADVFATLRSPRMLGLAVELLDAHDIELIEELSVSRLLFEHTRRAETAGAAPMTGQDFAKTLRTIAEQYVDRVGRNQQDDLKLFDAKDDALHAVLSTRFFRTVNDEPNQYEIQQEGLELALGLWLVSALEKEERNGREPGNKLAEILQPVIALDQVSDIVESALQASCLKETCSTKVQAALIEFYVGLQNLPERGLKPFIALVRKAPEAFLLAAENLFQTQNHIPNGEWLSEALFVNRDDPAVWEAIKAKVPGWLSLYSLAPERMMFRRRGHDSDEQVEDERAKRQIEVDRHMALLTKTERSLLERLTPAEQPYFAELQKLAFTLLAGKPLADLAEPLTNWAFSDALNSSIYGPHREFEYLIRFNPADWAHTRTALLGAIAPLETEGSRSRVGAWAVVHILRATGSIEDAARAADLAEWLTRDRVHNDSFRRVETYSETDPCDPGSKRPENMGPTAEKYAALDPSHLSTQMGRTAEDHFFTDARPGVARFAPQVGAEAIARLARDVLGREGFGRRQGALTLLPHAAVLDEELAREFLAAGQARGADLGENGEDRDAWLTAQYSLFMAFPHLSGNDQLAALAALTGSVMLLQLMRALKPADEPVVEQWLKHARESGDCDLQVRILAAVHYSEPALSDASQRVISHFIDADHDMVRMQALGIAAATKLPSLLERVVDVGWDAHTVSPSSRAFELWYGSSALVAAAEIGLLQADEAITRLRASHFGFLAKLGQKAAQTVATFLDSLLANTLNLKIDTELPEIEGPTPTGAALDPPLVSLEDRVSEPKDLKSAFDRMNETSEEFDSRQRRAGRAYDRFRADVEAAEADLALEDLTIAGVAAIAAAAPASAEEWLRALLAATDEQLQNLYDFAYELARALCDHQPKSSAEMFLRLEKIDPRVRRVIGAAKLPTVALAAWSGAGVSEIEAYCFGRLERTVNDDELATEVLAASAAGRQELLSQYADALLATGEPAKICRALMVCGYSDENNHASAILELYHGAEGFIGKAAQAALAAYQRNRWAKHWHNKMMIASTPLEFWRHSVLFTKLVDSRYSLWGEARNAGSNTFLNYRPTIDEELRRRIGKWKDKRRKELFGDSVPPPVFLR